MAVPDLQPNPVLVTIPAIVQAQLALVPKPISGLPVLAMQLNENETSEGVYFEEMQNILMQDFDFGEYYLPPCQDVRRICST